MSRISRNQNSTVCAAPRTPDPKLFAILCRQIFCCKQAYTPVKGWSRETWNLWQFYDFNRDIDI